MLYLFMAMDFAMVRNKNLRKTEQTDELCLLNKREQIQ